MFFFLLDSTRWREEFPNHSFLFDFAARPTLSLPTFRCFVSLLPVYRSIETACPIVNLEMKWERDAARLLRRLCNRRNLPRPLSSWLRKCSRVALVTNDNVNNRRPVCERHELFSAATRVCCSVCTSRLWGPVVHSSCHTVTFRLHSPIDVIWFACCVHRAMIQYAYTEYMYSNDSLLPPKSKLLNGSQIDLCTSWSTRSMSNVCCCRYSSWFSVLVIGWSRAYMPHDVQRERCRSTIVNFFEYMRIQSVNEKRQKRHDCMTGCVYCV